MILFLNVFLDSLASISQSLLLVVSAPYFLNISPFLNLILGLLFFSSRLSWLGNLSLSWNYRPINQWLLNLSSFPRNSSMFQFLFPHSYCVVHLYVPQASIQQHLPKILKSNPLGYFPKIFLFYSLLRLMYYYLLCT